MKKLVNNLNISKLSSRQICKGISLSSAIWLQIDKDKGDISRSRFIQRLIEKAYLIGEYNTKKLIGSHDRSPGRHNVSCEPFTHNLPLEMVRSRDE